MPKTSTERVRRFQARQRERLAYVREVVETDVQVVVEQTQWGTLRITWDMSQETHAALECFCAVKGFALDDLLQDLNRESLAKSVPRRQGRPVAQRVVARAGPVRTGITGPHTGPIFYPDPEGRGGGRGCWIVSDTWRGSTK